MDFSQVDVFAEGPYGGNPLAVYPHAGDLTGHQMQSIAREMNLSETAFVMSASGNSYEVRIFTPEEELSFAGHPTLGTAWTLRQMGLLTSDHVTQSSSAGFTQVWFEDDLTWFRRNGKSSPDLDIPARVVAEGLGVRAGDIGVRFEGEKTSLRPAKADIGIEHFIVPMRDIDALRRVKPHAAKLEEISSFGAYCFTATSDSTIEARGLFPGTGIPEDPATGSGAAALGVYLCDRVGPISLTIEQGSNIGRPSRMELRADESGAAVGGRCHAIFEGRLEVLP